MELIVKTTQRCNMDCTFCAASKTDKHIGVITPEEIADAVEKLNCKSVIITGGEILTLPVKYFQKLFALLDDSTEICLVSNLKGFYLHPDMWTPIFLDPRVTVCTSFNYGNTRKWDKNTVYTEDMFCKVMSLFKERVGYMPMFISVIDSENAHLWKKHLALAEKLGTTCRLNNALAIGREQTTYPRYKLYKIWTEIVDMGKADLEVNAHERGLGRCPENCKLLCKSTIRVMKKGTDGKIHYYCCDDDSNREENELSDIKPEPPKCTAPTKVLKKECYSCELFRLCNGCESNVSCITDKEAYCMEMQKLKPTFIRQGWLL